MEDDTKLCPFCHESINQSAILCKHCKSNLSNVKTGEDGILYKRCQFCCEEVNFDAVKCKHCGSSLTAKTCDPIFPGYADNSKPKSRMIYILLGIFLGGLGIHNFYTGYYLQGAIKLGITVISCGWLYLAAWIWGIVEICTIRTDGAGQEFVE